MAQRSTKVTLSAQVQGYIAGMEKASRATRDAGSEAEKLAQKSQAFELMGRAAMVAGGAVVAGLGLATKAAIDWDSAWAGVLKTVDGSPEQLGAVEKGLRGLTSVLPASHTEIAAVAEAAGQLGVQTDNVVEFTRTMIDLGETTNLSAEQAATSLARFMNIMGTSQGDVSRLGSAIVGLGNNFASTEGEILEMATRIAGAGAQIGLTEGEVLGLSTALSSVGIEAQAGGSAISKVMIDMAASVDEGGERLQMFADVAGISAEQFAKQWAESPAEALNAFIQGLANTEAQGKTTLGVLAELEINEVRMRDALLRAAGASDIFAEAMAMGNDEFEKNTALTEEAELRYETTAAKLDIMKNQVMDAAISLGEHLLPAVEYVAESVGIFADGLSGLEGPMGAFVSWGGLILGTGLLGAGVWLTAIPMISRYKDAMVSLNLTGGRLERTLRGIGRVAALGLAIGVIAALVRKTEADTTKLAEALERTSDATEHVNKAAEAYEGKGWGRLYGDLSNVKTGTEDVSAALEYAQAQANKKWWDPSNLPGEADFRRTLEALRLVGDEMAALYGDDIPTLNEKLREMSNAFDLSAEEQWEFIENSPALKEALENSADAFGLTTDKADLMELAFGRVQVEAEGAADGTDVATEAAEAMAQAADEAAGELDDMRRALEDVAREALNMGEAQDRAQAALNRMTEAAKEETATLYGTNEASIALRGSIRDVEQSHRDSAAAILENDGTLEDAISTWHEGRDSVIDMRMSMGDSREEAIKWADENLGSAKEVESGLKAVSDAVKGIERNPKINIQANTSGAEAQFQSFIDRNSGRTVWVNMRTTQDQSVSYGPGVGGLADGGIMAYANGGMHEFASGGGVDTGIYSGGTPIIKFAEPETGWEAFISGKPSQRERNRQIWVETGDRLGMNAPGQSGPVQVSLAGAVLKASIDGRPIDVMIHSQIASALSPFSSGAVRSAGGTY